MNERKETLSLGKEVSLRFKMFAKPITEEADWSNIRRSRTRLCLQTWNRIDSEKDANFDIGALPALNVDTPRGTGLPPGITPVDIKDIHLRKEYMRDIQKNREKAKYYNKQYQISKLENEYKRIASSYLINLYSKPPKAIDEITELLEIYMADKTKINDLIEGISSKW